jgi:hypothetical protein
MRVGGFGVGRVGAGFAGARGVNRVGNVGVGRGDWGVAGVGVNRVGAVGVGPGDWGVAGGAAVVAAAPRYAAAVVAPGVVPADDVDTTVAVGCGQQVVAP